MSEKMIKSVVKALTILDILALEDPGREGIKLTDLADRMGIPPNTLHTLLRTMIARQYVTQYDHGRYGAGPRIGQIALIDQIRNQNLPSGMGELLTGLRDAIEENVQFYILLSGQRICVAQYPFEGVIRVHLPAAYADDNIYAKATGRVMTAYCSDSELGEIIARWGLPGPDWDHAVSRDQLDEKRRQVRSTGYATNTTPESGLKGYGYPVLNGSKRMIGVIGVYAPLFRVQGEKDALILREMARTAEAMGKKK